jgi:hypothetical protein
MKDEGRKGFDCGRRRGIGLQKEGKKDRRKEGKNRAKGKKGRNGMGKVGKMREGGIIMGMREGGGGGNRWGRWPDLTDDDGGLPVWSFSPGQLGLFDFGFSLPHLPLFLFVFSGYFITPSLYYDGEREGVRKDESQGWLLMVPQTINVPTNKLDMVGFLLPFFLFPRRPKTLEK